MLNNLQLATIPEADEAMRAEYREFIAQAVNDLPPHRRARSWAGFDAEFSRKLAARGWVGLTLPRELGGGGRSPFARYVLSEELLAVGAPVAAHWIADRQSGPLICKYGTAQQKQFYIPRICKAEAFFCIGMSEPGSGSDLASVRTRATQEGDRWRLNGQKIWTTHAQHSHYMIALVRTSGSAEDRNKGLSQLIIDLSLPGVVVRPIVDLAGDAHFCEVFFDNVMLDASALIGSAGSGWEQVTAELAYERSGPERIYSSIVLLEPWLQWLRSLPAASDALLAQAGAIVSHLAALRNLSIAVTARLADGHSPVVEAALVKDLGTEFEQQLPRLIADTAYADPDTPPPAELLRTLSYVTKVAPAFSLRGGTREILRGMIARGLGLR
jgi:alkylation response protein AidB-like acyl-CoA dehydrogenase